MTTMLSEIERRMTSQIVTPRCLILVNPKASALAMRTTVSRTVSKLFMRRSTDAALQYEQELSTLARISELAGAMRLDANVELLPAANDLPALIHAAEQEGFNTIVAAGGDGTVGAIVQHLVNSPLRLGIIPLGSANNIARTLRVPHDLEEALRVVAAGLERSIDVGKIVVSKRDAGQIRSGQMELGQMELGQMELGHTDADGMDADGMDAGGIVGKGGVTYFLGAAGVGLFADALISCEGKELYLWQIPRAIRAIAPLCWNPRYQRYKLVLDGVTRVQEGIMIAVSNAAYLGEGFVVAPDARLNDGMLDVVVLGAMNRWELLRFILAAALSPRAAQGKVQRSTARNISICSPVGSKLPLSVHADDNVVLSPNPVTTAPVRKEILNSSDVLSSYVNDATSADENTIRFTVVPRGLRVLCAHNQLERL